MERPRLVDYRNIGSKADPTFPPLELSRRQAAGQKTLPWQMFTGLREQISPTILAVASIMVAISIVLLTTLEMLRRRAERLRGMSPG